MASTRAREAAADETVRAGRGKASGEAKIRYPRSQTYVLAVRWENGKITDEQFIDGLTEQLLELESSTRELPFPEVVMIIQQSACAPGGATKFLLPRSLALLPRMGAAPIHVINRLIAQLSRTSNLQSTLTVYKCLRDRKYSPSNYTLTSLMAACSKAKNADAACKLFAASVNEGVVPNTTNYNALITACSSANDLERGLAVFKEMKARGVPYDAHSLNIVIGLATDCGDSDLAIRLFSEVTAEQPEIGLSTGSGLLAHIIRECGKVNRLADALRFFEAARARPTFTPDVIVLSSLINACGLAGDMEKAMQIFRDMTNVYNVKPNAVTYGTTCRWLAASKKLPEAMALHNDMIANGIKPNLATYNGLLEGTAKEVRPDLAQSILAEMDEKRIRPNASTLTFVVSALIGVKLRANSAPLSAVEKGLSEHAKLVPEALDQQRFVEAFETTCTFVNRHKITMDTITLRILLEASVQLGDWRRARAISNMVPKRRLKMGVIDDLITRINEQPPDA